MKAIEARFRDLVREHRRIFPVSMSPLELTAEICEELRAIDEQAYRLEPDDEITRHALARIVALVLEADRDWHRPKNHAESTAG